MKSGLEHISGVETLAVRNSGGKTAVIMLHGYGASMHDLFPLWELWHQVGFNWFFPNGVLTLPMGYYEGRCWFSIDMEALDQAMRAGTHRDMTSTSPPELPDSLKTMEAFVSAIAATHERVILGGFSQGAMMVSHLGTKPNLKLCGLVLLSGALIAEASFPASAQGLPFYQSHGSQDPLLSVAGAQDLERKLQSLNFHGLLKVFSGGHEIPPSVIQEAKTFLGQFA